MQQTPTSPTNGNQPGGHRSNIDLLELIWRRRNWVIWCTLICISLGVLYCRLAPPIYESTADVLVIQKRPHVVTGDNQFETGFEDYLATHLAIITSPLIVERAIEASDLGSLKSFKDLEDPEEDLVDAIIDNLEVKGGSRDLGESADSIMALAFYSKVPEDCPKVVQAILDSYEDFHHEVYRGMSDSTVGLISQARDLLRNDLMEQEESYNQFRQTSPLVARGTDEVNPLQDRLTTIEVQRSEILLRRAEVERQLLSLEQARQDGSDDQQLLAMITEMRQQATTDNSLPDVSTALEAQLIQLIDDEQELLALYGPNHPHVQSMRKRIADTRRLYAMPTAAHVSEQKTGDGSETSSVNADPVAVYTQYLEQEQKSLQISEDLLTKLYENEHDAAKEHSIFQLKDERYHRDIERTGTLYEVVISRLQEASLVGDFGGFETKVIAPPRLGEKVGPSLRIFLPVAAVVGVFFGCILAGFADLRDGSFHSSEHIKQQLGLPVLGQIPQFAAVRRKAKRDVVCDRMLCTHLEPWSVPAESFRSLRTALFFNRPGETPAVIQVTGPSDRDGASTVAANLAISLAQTGKRVLLIDADLRRQKQFQMFGIAPPESGLVAIIDSDAEPGDLICPTVVDNLSLLPAGCLPAGPCELFTSPRFGELIKLFRDSYDHVLIDTGPLLSGSDPSVIASQTDGVVLTIRLTQDSRLRARRATELLDRLDVRMLGVVVNGVRGANRNRRPKGRHDDSGTLDPSRSRPERTIMAAES